MSKKNQAHSAESLMALFKQLAPEEQERFREQFGLTKLAKMVDALSKMVKTIIPALNVVDELVIALYPDIVDHRLWKKEHGPPEELSYSKIAARHGTSAEAVRKAIDRLPEHEQLIREIEERSACTSKEQPRT